MDNNNEKRGVRKGGDELEPSPPSEERGSAQENVPSTDEEWTTGIFECISCGEHQRSDLEICALGTFVPCVLYGMNCGEAHDLPRDCKVRCMACSSLCYVGVCGISWTLLALYPMFIPPIWICAAGIMSIPRHVLRHRYNLKDTSESFCNTMFCCGRVDWRKREWAKFQDIPYIPAILHQMCHPCALCQEARELRRRRKETMPPVLFPPPPQDMARQS